MLATELARIVTKVFTIYYESKVLCKKTYLSEKLDARD